MNGATMAAARLVLAGGVYNYRALRAMAERHDRHCFQEADRLCQEAGIGGCLSQLDNSRLSTTQHIA